MSDVCLQESGSHGLVKLYPHIDYQVPDPDTNQPLQAVDWTITGLWTLAQVTSPAGKLYWTDLPCGTTRIIAPCFLDPETGVVRRLGGPHWYSDLTRSAWQQRDLDPVTLEVERRHEARRVCLVNCLMPWWGDAVSLLLRINQIPRHLDLDLVVLVPKALAWLVPDYVAEVWIDTAGLAALKRWRAGLGQAVKDQISRFEIAYLPISLQPAHLSQRELQEFTRIPPFPRQEWLTRLEQQPTVTFMWRTDRCWAEERPRSRWSLPTPLGRGLLRGYRKWRQQQALQEQIRRVTQLAAGLKQQLPNLDFAVCGLGRQGSLPEWIQDLRTDTIDQQTNLDWCQRASQSHVLLGVLGSHLVLPSGHAGAIVQFVPWNFYRNVLTDILITTEDPREALYCYRLLSLETDPQSARDTVLSLLVNYPYMYYALHGEFYRPLPHATLQTITQHQRLRAQILSQIASDALDPLIGP